MRSIDELLRENYPVTVYQEDGEYVIEVNDFPGCMAAASTVEEAFAELEHAKRAWMESRRAAGLEIPESSIRQTEFSGKCLVRMPKYLHARLVRQASQEGTSLNQYVVSLLADASASRQALENCRTELLSRRTAEACGVASVEAPAGTSRAVSSGKTNSRR